MAYALRKCEIRPFFTGRLLVQVQTCSFEALTRHRTHPRYPFKAVVLVRRRIRSPFLFAYHELGQEVSHCRKSLEVSHRRKALGGFALQEGTRRFRSAGRAWRFRIADKVAVGLKIARKTAGRVAGSAPSAPPKLTLAWCFLHGVSKLC